jgi:hypothetical protein
VNAQQLVLTAIPPEELEDLRRQPDELAQADWFWAKARAFVREHPDAFLRLTAAKLFHFWWFAEQTGIEYPRSWLRLYQAYYVLIVALAVVGLTRGLGRGARSRQDVVLLLLFLAALSGLQSLYYVEGRHRWEVEPMVLALSGCGAAVLLGRRRGIASGEMPPRPGVGA